MKKTDLKTDLYNIIAQIAQVEAKSILQGLPKEKSIVYQHPTSTLIGWLKDKTALYNFFTILISYGFIACTFESFKAHFIESETIPVQTKWLSYKKHLVYLFHMLQLHGFIPIHNHPHKLVKEHFIDQLGKELNTDSLRTSLKDVRNNENSQVIEEIIHRMNKS
jgi:hypothetical protein